MTLPLSDRYARLSPAVVRIQTSKSSGTGFFVNSSGLLITAAHVVYDKVFSMVGAAAQIVAAPISDLTITFSDGSNKTASIPPLIASDNDNAAFDVAAIKTGLSTPSFIPLATSATVNVGDHLVAIGFPSSSPAGVLYDGFLSSVAVNAPTGIGFVQGTNQIVSIFRTLMRVQMPITRGASGGPVISDKDEVLGVIAEVPVQWTQELTRLIDTFRGPSATSGVILSGFDTTKILADLAFIVSEFQSPGAGIAVPVSYLKIPQP